VKAFIDSNKASNLLNYKIIINPKNYGTCKSLNTALAQVNDDYFVLLAGDDYFERDALTNLSNHLFNKDFDMIGGVIKIIAKDNIEADNKFNAMVNYNNLNSVEKTKVVIGGGLPVASGGTLFKTNKIREIGGFDENFHVYEDRPLFIKIAINNLKIAKVNTYVLNYRQGVGITNKNNLMSLALLRDQVYLFNVYYPKLTKYLNLDSDYFKKLAKKHEISYEIRVRNQNPFKLISYVIMNLMTILTLINYKKLFFRNLS
jgi:glycosyltransferase involved in cell wall biosynthesis